MTLTLPLAAIFLLYAFIGILAAIGAVAFHRLILKNQMSEQRYNALLLPFIALIYVPFSAHFSDGSAWATELLAVAIFVTLGLLGWFSRLAVALGYLGHGIWDIVHELDADVVAGMFEPGQLTEIPLAYGAFCLAYDVAIGLRMLLVSSTSSTSRERAATRAA